MTTRNRKILIGAAAALLLALYAAPGHRADIRILAAQSGDAHPHRIQAVLDIGMVAVSLLVTWSTSLVN